MKAEEARELTLKNFKTDMIYKHIEEACKKGKFEVYYEYPLAGLVMRELQENGFKISKTSYTETSDGFKWSTHIHWGL